MKIVSYIVPIDIIKNILAQRGSDEIQFFEFENRILFQKFLVKRNHKEYFNFSLLCNFNFFEKSYHRSLAQFANFLFQKIYEKTNYDVIRALVKNNKFNHKEYSYLLLKLNKDLFDSKKFNWQIDSWAIVSFAPEFFDPKKFNWKDSWALIYGLK